MSSARRYPFTSAEDAGLGAEEFEGPARFTRPCERLIPVPVAETDDEALDARIRLHMLDRAADLLHEVLDETPADDAHRPRLRELAFAVKDVADEINREMRSAPEPAGQQVFEGATPHHQKDRNV